MNWPIGKFLRPVGGFAYCLKLKRVVTDQWQFERWGMKENRPFNDGHRNSAYINGIRQIAPGIFKNEDGCDFGPRYFKLIQEQPTVQLDLFAEAA